MLSVPGCTFFAKNHSTLLAVHDLVILPCPVLLLAVVSRVAGKVASVTLWCQPIYKFGCHFLASAKSADNRWLPARIATRKGGCQPMLSLSPKMPSEAQKKCNFVKYSEICIYVRHIRIFWETALGIQFWSDDSQFIIFSSPGHSSHLLLHLISGCK